MVVTLDYIQQKVTELSLIISAPADLLPTYGYTVDGAYPHIEVDDAGLHFVVVERGQELERKTTGELNELLYWIFLSVTFSMACKYELANRVARKDSRRMMFQKQEELLGMLDSGWRQKLENYHEAVLEKHPFDDLASERASYCGFLRSKGYSESEIEELASKEYPMA